MKHFALISLVICSFFSVYSCTAPDGDWDPIIVDYDTVYFGEDGGTKVVSITKNYNSWRTSGITDNDTNKTYYPDDERNVVEGNGIKVVVDGKTLTITVSPTSTPSESHQWSVHMACGDAFKSIKVWQNKPKVE